MPRKNNLPPKEVEQDFFKENLALKEEVKRLKRTIGSMKGGAATQKKRAEELRKQLYDTKSLLDQTLSEKEKVEKRDTELLVSQEHLKKEYELCKEELATMTARAVLFNTLPWYKKMRYIF